jgi:tRNA-2-methylthio-N6-dimethylallyladenosine synthase
MALVEQVGYDALYIFKYSERPGTPAAKLDDDVTQSEKTARFLELEMLQQRLQQKIYESYLGREIRVLVEGRSAKSDRDMTGHSTCHKVVNFPRASVTAGQVAQVRVTEAKANSLYGDLVSAA